MIAQKYTEILEIIWIGSFTHKAITFRSQELKTRGHKCRLKPRFSHALWKTTVCPQGLPKFLFLSVPKTEHCLFCLSFKHTAGKLPEFLLATRVVPKTFLVLYLILRTNSGLSLTFWYHQKNKLTPHMHTHVLF